MGQNALRAAYGTLRCTRCGAGIMVGDELTQRTPTKQYHQACYEDMIHIPEKVERLDSDEKEKTKEVRKT